MESFLGHLAKMKTSLGELVDYHLPLDQLNLHLNPLLGRPVKMVFTGKIHCQECGRKIRKTYHEGHCYLCTRALAKADLCILRPESCHYHLGSCREPDWGLANCFSSHYVYLANSSGMKVGITRAKNIPSRWMDQGAAQALPIFKVGNRLQSGKLEVMFKALVSDKTNWRKMLAGDVPPLDLKARRDALIKACAEDLNCLRVEWGDALLLPLPDADVVHITYPIRSYPKKVMSLNFNKNPVVAGNLEGIKGQYLIFDCGVINIRKFAGYEVEVSI